MFDSIGSFIWSSVTFSHMSVLFIYLFIWPLLVLICILVCVTSFYFPLYSDHQSVFWWLCVVFINCFGVCFTFVSTHIHVDLRVFIFCLSSWRIHMYNFGYWTGSFVFFKKICFMELFADKVKSCQLQSCHFCLKKKRQSQQQEYSTNTV